MGEGRGSWAGGARGAGRGGEGGEEGEVRDGGGGGGKCRGGDGWRHCWTIALRGCTAQRRSQGEELGGGCGGSGKDDGGGKRKKGTRDYNRTEKGFEKVTDGLALGCNSVCVVRRWRRRS